MICDSTPTSLITKSMVLILILLEYDLRLITLEKDGEADICLNPYSIGI